MKHDGTLPRPRLTLRVGIVGHRLNKLGPEAVETVRRRLTESLAEIDRTLRRTASRPSCRAYSELPPEIRIVSGLAEGADRLAVQCAPPGWALTAILPMPVADYERDFLAEGETASASLTEFRTHLAEAACVTELPMLGPEGVIGDPDRRNQYAALGTFLVRQVDVLVAVWDGHQAEGPGGTALIVADAIRRNISVIWIQPDPAAGTRLFSGYPQADLTQPQAEAVSEAALERALLDIVGFNPTAAAGPLARAHEGHGGGGHPPGREPLPAYVREHWPKPLRWAIAFPLLRKLSGAGGWPSWPATYASEAELLRSWDPFLAAAGEAARPDSIPLPLGDVRHVLLPRSVWADALSWYHGQLYRSAYVTIFVLAGLSVPIGLLYLFLQDSPAVLDIKAGFVMAELLIIVAVVVLVKLGTRRHWHRTWIETRELSELLRLGRPLACVGALADLVDVTRAVGGSRESYPTWYVRATVREMRPVSGLLDGAHLNRILQATLATEIAEQIDYHRSNARNLVKVQHFLHRWGTRCFGATIAVLILYLALWGIDLSTGLAHAAEPGHGGGHGGALTHFLHVVVKPTVSILAAGLPAFGAALAGIGAQGDFADRAERSEATAEQLELVRREIETMVAGSGAPLSLERANAALLAATRIMLEDVQSWRQTYVSKGLALPA